MRERGALNYLRWQAIKKVCRKLGVTKWPYREMRFKRRGSVASTGGAEAGSSDVGESNEEVEEENEGGEDGQDGGGAGDDGGSDHDSDEFSRVDSSGSAVGIQGWNVLMAAAHRISEEVEKQEQAGLNAEYAAAAAEEPGVSQTRLSESISEHQQAEAAATETSDAATASAP